MNNFCVPYSINAGGRLLNLSSPCVMGIVNVTPDSFYTVKNQVGTMLNEGALIIDVGGCSTRPNGDLADSITEQSRLAAALDIIRNTFPDCVVSVDTFRANIAAWCIHEYGVQIINDISGGDDAMYDVVAQHGVPYILTFNEPRSNDIEISQQASLFFADRVQQLRDRGAKDIILDPGFGFNKTLDENYELLNNLDVLQILELPILVGVSHKSMIYKLLNTTPEATLNGTTVLHTLALTKGANILRVHEVRAAIETIKILDKF